MIPIEMPMSSRSLPRILPAAHLLPALLAPVLLFGGVACPPSLGGDDDASAADDDTVDDDDDGTVDDDDSWDDDDVIDDDDVSTCGIGDFELAAVALGDDGEPDTIFAAAESVTTQGELYNPCPDDITFQTNTGCLLDPFTLGNESGNGVGRGCDDAITTWTIGSRETLVDGIDWGMLETGWWVFEAGFGPGGQYAGLEFEVVAPRPG
jgi:hypothetical protein